jgi:hypothetical protein
LSYSSDFNLYVGSRTQTHVDFLRALFQHGWSPERSKGEGIIVYELPTDAAFVECSTAPVGEIEDVLIEMSKYDRQGRTYGMHLSWPGEKDRQIKVLFYPHEYPDNDVIQINIDQGGVILSSAPPLTDHNWYLDRILPACRECEFFIHTLEWFDAI